MIKLTPKPAKFSAAHSLRCFGEGHPCARKHGHTWIATATFEGEPDRDGVLVPYEVVGKVVGWLDHQDLDDLLDFPSTGELLAAYIGRELQARVGSRARVVRVVLEEDPAPIPHVVEWTPREGSTNG